MPMYLSFFIGWIGRSVRRIPLTYVSVMQVIVWGN